MAASSAALVRKVLSRSVLIFIVVFASLGALAALVYGALAQTALSIGVTTVEVSILGAEELTPDLAVPDSASAQYATTWIDVAAGDTPAASLISVVSLLPYLVAGLTCLMILGLAVQLLRGKPFGLLSGIAMLALAVITIGTGIAVPALTSLAEVMFVEHLGLPTSGDAASVWVSPSTPSWEFSDWPMILLGLLTALGGWLILRARQLRMDLEGTI